MGNRLFVICLQFNSLFFGKRDSERKIILKEDKRKLLAKIAYLYYIEDKPQSEIAKELNIYRTTISRMIKQARKEGIVNIEIQEFNSHIFDLELYVKRKFSLKDIVIVPTNESDSEEQKDEKLAKEAAAFLKRNIHYDSIVGLSWGSTLGRTISKIENKKKTNTTFVPIVGGPSHINSKYHVNTLVYDLARKLNGKSAFVNASAVQETKGLKEGIMNSKYFKELRDYWKSLDIAIVGIGGPLNTKESQWRDLLTDKDYEELKIREAIGDCCCRFFDQDGKIIKGSLYCRTIGLDLDELSKVPMSVGIARSKRKSKSILAMLKRRYINTLVTDEETILDLLKTLNDPFLDEY